MSILPILSGEEKIGAAFARAVTALLLGQYERLGGRSDDQPSAFHCPFILDVTPRVLRMAEDFTCPGGAGLAFVRGRALAFHEARWWYRLPQGSYATFLTALQAALEIGDARHLALLADNFAPQDRALFAVDYLRRMQRKLAAKPDVIMPPEAMPFSVMVRHAFYRHYPLMINDNAFLPNRRAGRYDAASPRSLSRGFLAMPALCIARGDAVVSTINQVLGNR